MDWKESSLVINQISLFKSWTFSLIIHLNTFLQSHLYSAITPVCYNDVTISIHSHPGGGVELSVALTMRAKFKQELSICTVHLGIRKSTKTCQWCYTAGFVILVSDMWCNAKVFARQQRYACTSITHYSSFITAWILTFTEWLWKSVTTISFFLFTATKCGPEGICWEEYVGHVFAGNGICSTWKWDWFM